MKKTTGKHTYIWTSNSKYAKSAGLVGEGLLLPFLSSILPMLAGFPTSLGVIQSPSADFPMFRLRGYYSSEASDQESSDVDPTIPDRTA